MALRGSIFVKCYCTWHAGMTMDGLYDDGFTICLFGKTCYRQFDKT